MQNLNIEDYLYEFHKDEDAALMKCIPEDFMREFSKAYNEGFVCSGAEDCSSAEEYALCMAYEVVVHEVDKEFCKDDSKWIEFDITEEQLTKWWKLHKKYSTDKFVDETDVEDWHLLTEFEGNRKKLKEFLLTQANWNYQMQEKVKTIRNVVPARDNKYRNIDGIKLPRGWVSIDRWAMPEEVSHFFPGNDLLFGGAIFYLHDGMWWDLIKHEYTEN